MCKTGNELENCVIMSISHPIHLGVALSVHLLMCLFSGVQISTDIKKKIKMSASFLFTKPDKWADTKFKEIILMQMMLLLFKWVNWVNSENQAEECGKHFIFSKAVSLIFLFLSLCLISLSCCLTDISPPAQGVDHRHVQKELGEVIVRLHNPVVLSPTTIQVTWTVSAVQNIAIYNSCYTLRKLSFLFACHYTSVVYSTHMKSAGLSEVFPLIYLHSFTCLTLQT